MRLYHDSSLPYRRLEVLQDQVGGRFCNDVGDLLDTSSVTVNNDPLKTKMKVQHA